MNIRNSFIPLIIIGVIVIGILYFFQNQSLEEHPTNVPKITVSPEKAVDEKGPTIGLNMTLSPVFLNISLNPGQQADASFKLTNNNPIQEEVKLSLLKFKANATGNHPVPIDVAKDDQINTLVTFPQSNFKLAPNETKNVSFTFKSPQNAELGYYFAIMITRQKEREADKREAVIAGAPSLPVLVEVRSPYAKKAAELVDFKTKQAWFEYTPVEFETTIKNTGNIHLVPFGDIFIDQGNNKEIGTALVNEPQGNILPQTQRTYYSFWNDGFITRNPKMKDGQFVIDKNGDIIYETKVDWSKINKLRIGKYSATAIMVYSDGTRDIPLEAKTSFWIIPWKIIIGLMIVLFLLFQGIKSFVVDAGSSLKSKSKH